MGDVVRFASPESSERLWASALGAYANSPEQWCIEHFNRPAEEIHKIRGIIFHCLLNIAARNEQRHIQWEKPSAIKQAKPYLPAENFVASIVPMVVFGALYAVPMGIIHALWPAKTFLYGLGVGLAALVVTLIISLMLAPRKGLTPGKSLAIDDVVLHSELHMLDCRPDRIVQRGKRIIPEEWKSHRYPRIGDVIQLATALILLEEECKQRPRHGVLIMGNGKAYRIKNTPELRQKVFMTLTEMRMVIHHLKAEFGTTAQGRI